MQTPLGSRVLCSQFILNIALKSLSIRHLKVNNNSRHKIIFSSDVNLFLEKPLRPRNLFGNKLYATV